MSRAFRAVALAAGAALVVACSDPFAPRARTETLATSFSIGAINVPQAGVPVTWRIATGVTFRLDSLGEPFDLAFEITPDNRVRLWPVGKVVTTILSAPGQGAHRVGVLPVAGTYDALTIAPERGYLIDSTQVVAVGQVVAVRTETNYCALDPNGRTELFAKFVVDSVQPVTRRLFVRATAVRSCGFRSFAAGIPTT
jgi:hypothetical protein